MPDNKSLITGSKDCALIHWDLGSGKKMIFNSGKKFNKDFSDNGHFDEICSLAISQNGKFMITGGKDRMVRVWDIHN